MHGGDLIYVYTVKRCLHQLNENNITSHKYHFHPLIYSLIHLFIFSFMFIEHLPYQVGFQQEREGAL